MRELGLTDLERVDGGIALGGVTSFSPPTAQQPPNMFGLPGGGPFDLGLGSIGAWLHDPAVGQVVHQFLQNPAIQEAIDELREASPQLAGIINQFTQPNQGGNLTLPFGLNGNGLNPLNLGAFAPPGFPSFAPPPFAPPVFSFPQAGPLAGPLGVTGAPVTGSLTVGPNETSYSTQANGANGGYSYSYSYSGSSSGGAPNAAAGAPAGFVAAGTTPV